MANTDLLKSISDLALDLRSSWNHAADELWRHLDPELWNLTHNPWLVLQTVSRPRLDAAFADGRFRKKLDEVLADRTSGSQKQRWFQTVQTGSRLSTVAYFSMEFMLSDALPIYSGGLGNVAGDHLKAASDLGVPIVGVGLLYQQGYFRQHIDADGNQIALHPYNEPGQLPISPLRDAKGEWLRISVAAAGVCALFAHLGGEGRADETLSARYERRRQPARISRHHERALWRRAGIAAAAGAHSGHRGMAAAADAGDSSGSLPSQ